MFLLGLRTWIDKISQVFRVVICVVVDKHLEEGDQIFPLPQLLANLLLSFRIGRSRLEIRLIFWSVQIFILLVTSLRASCHLKTFSIYILKPAISHRA